MSVSIVSSRRNRAGGRKKGKNIAGMPVPGNSVQVDVAPPRPEHEKSIRHSLVIRGTFTVRERMERIRKKEEWRREVNKNAGAACSL